MMFFTPENIQIRHALTHIMKVFLIYYPLFLSTIPAMQKNLQFPLLEARTNEL
jgi:hypothetical protein